MDQDGVISGVLNQILIEMDGFVKNENVFVIAATNFPDSLDKASMRSGRFDKVLNIPKPQFKAREKILTHFLKKQAMDKTVNVERLAKLTVGYTGADLKNAVNLAVLNQVKADRQQLTIDDFIYSLDRINIGTLNKSL